MLFSLAPRIQRWKSSLKITSDGSDFTFFFFILCFLSPTTLDSAGLEVLVPKRGMFPPSKKTMVSLNWKLRLLPGLFIPVNQQIVEGLTVWVQQR